MFLVVVSRYCFKSIWIVSTSPKTEGDCTQNSTHGDARKEVQFASFGYRETIYCNCQKRRKQLDNTSLFCSPIYPFPSRCLCY